MLCGDSPGELVDSVTCLSQVQIPPPGPLNPPLPDAVTHYGHLNLLHDASPHPHPKSRPHSSLGSFVPAQDWIPSSYFFQIPPPTRSLKAPPGNPEKTMSEPRPASASPQTMGSICLLGTALPQRGPHSQGLADMLISMDETQYILLTEHYFSNYKMGITLFTL